MDAGDVALAALRGIQPGGTANRKEFRLDAAPLQLAEQVVEADAVTADDDQIGELQLTCKKLHVDQRAGLDDFLMPADRRKAIRATERRHAARSLPHRIRRKCGRSCLV